MSPVPAPTSRSFQRASTVVASSWPLRSSLELGALPTAVPCARLHARHLAWEWGLVGMAETIELLVSELTTNSVQAMAGQDGQPTIRLRLLTDSARVRIEVWDADPRPPAPQDPAADGTPDLEAEGGRGLFLVAALSARWAWYATQEPMGKVTWCELNLVQLESPSENDGSAAQPRLPRRIPSAMQVRPAARPKRTQGRQCRRPRPHSGPRVGQVPRHRGQRPRTGASRAGGQVQGGNKPAEEYILVS
jgi:anti-sigma regulatory factor (Ser/Thr protein kinase)